jgi:hypothetical protein
MGAEARLELLEQLRLVLSSAGVRFRLRGGWGLDFLLGALTRAHADVDIVAWQRHRRRIWRALIAAEGALVDLPGTCEATRLLWRATDDRDSR